MRFVSLGWRSCGWGYYLELGDRFDGACGEDYEGNSNNQFEDGARYGVHYFCDFYEFSVPSTPTPHLPLPILGAPVMQVEVLFMCVLVLLLVV